MDRKFIINAIIGAGCPVDRDGTQLQLAGLVRFTGDQHNPKRSWIKKELEKLSTWHLRNLAGFGLETESPNPVFELDENAKMPVRSKPRSLGLDLFSCDIVHVWPGTTELIPLGIRCQFNEGWGAFIWDRSGMGVKGFHTFAGVIESDFTGLWGVVLHNFTSHKLIVVPEKAVAQVVFQPVWMGEPRKGIIIRDTDRGGAGFGSTD